MNDNNDPPAEEGFENFKIMNIINRLTNPSIVISTLCRRMLANQQIDNIIRYNLEVILEESEKIAEVADVLRLLSESGKERFDKEIREVE
jgi:hypothetical protein